jgi:hypothetical protein
VTTRGGRTISKKKLNGVIFKFEMECNMHGSEPKCKTETQVEEALNASRVTNKGAKRKTNVQITTNCRVVMAVKEESGIWKITRLDLDHNARGCVSFSQTKTSLLNDLGERMGAAHTKLSIRNRLIEACVHPSRTRSFRARPEPKFSVTGKQYKHCVASTDVPYKTGPVVVLLSACITHCVQIKQINESQETVRAAAG